MIISVHMPKSGGGTIKNIFQKSLGYKLRTDYLDLPLNHSSEERVSNAEAFYTNPINRLRLCSYRLKGIKCIHGHFLPYKYKYLVNNKHYKFITWLREPTERLISHYYYWQRSYEYNSAKLHKRVIEEKWSLEKFCLSEELKNVYNTFLWGFPIDSFDFIGLTEYLQQDLKHLNTQHFNNKLNLETIPELNKNKDKAKLYRESISDDLLEKIKMHHAKDYELYNYVVNKRTIRK